MRSITDVDVKFTQKPSMFVLWNAPPGAYDVTVWTPNGISITKKGSKYSIVEFTDLNDTKPYYVSIRAIGDKSTSCLPKEVTMGMFYMFAKGKVADKMC